MLIVDARAQGRQDVPCYLHALQMLQFAKARGDEWIRVDKPGHQCDFMVAALREQLNTNPAAAPRCLIRAHPLEHQMLGTTFETLTRNWPGANLISGPQQEFTLHGGERN